MGGDDEEEVEEEEDVEARFLFALHDALQPIMSPGQLRRARTSTARCLLTPTALPMRSSSS